jgi:hypothetical protein
VDRDEYTLTQRRVIDARLAEALEDVKKGRVYGPLDTVDEMLASLKRKRKQTSRSDRAPGAAHEMQFGLLLES